MFSPRVEFAGYSIPHPSEKKINLRIQTNGAAAAAVGPHTINHRGLGSNSPPPFSSLLFSSPFTRTGSITATEALRTALLRLQDLSDMVREKFQAQAEEYRQAHGAGSFRATARPCPARVSCPGCSHLSE